MAMLESGMDNSPMYDGAAFDNRTRLMLLYDVGMSALVAAEHRHLAALATSLASGRRLLIHSLFWIEFIVPIIGMHSSPEFAIRNFVLCGKFLNGTRLSGTIIL